MTTKYLLEANPTTQWPESSSRLPRFRQPKALLLPAVSTEPDPREEVGQGARNYRRLGIFARIEPYFHGGLNE